MKFPVNQFIKQSTITSFKVTSDDVEFNIVIDKILFKIDTEILIDDLLYFFDKNSFLYERYFKDGQTGIQVKSFIFFYYYNSKKIYSITSNPNHYHNISKYHEDFKKFVPDYFQKYLRISQADFALNIYNVPHINVLKTLNVNNKQTRSEIKTNRVEHKTLYLGKLPRLIVAYDKKNKIKKSINKSSSIYRNLITEIFLERASKYSHWSVVEVQLSGIELPARDYQTFFKAIRNKDFNPFANVEITNYRFKDFSKVSRKLEKLYYTIQAELNIVGYFETKKNQNQNGNFQRDFSKVADSGPPLKLQDFYHTLIKDYLKTPIKLIKRNLNVVAV